MQEISIFWHRRDLRVNDNVGLYHALSSKRPVLLLFIFDSNILDALGSKRDLRVNFIHRQLKELSAIANSYNSTLIIKYGKPFDVWKELIGNYTIKSVFCNHDYEPYAITRDTMIETFLRSHSISFNTYKDHVIFEKDEVLSALNTPYKVYTPYKNKWLDKIKNNPIKNYESEKLLHNLLKIQREEIFPLSKIGFEEVEFSYPSSTVLVKIIKEYAEKRDRVSLDATSKMGIHFRFGTISIREKVKKALLTSEVWLSELIWREFFIQLMYHFPRVIHHSFNEKFEKIRLFIKK